MIVSADELRVILERNLAAQGGGGESEPLHASGLTDIDYFRVQKAAADYGLDYNRLCSAIRYILAATKESKP